MVDELEVPLPLARLQIDRHQALAEKVVAGTVAAVVVAGRDLDREVGDAQFLVHRQVGPHARVAGVDRRVVQPGVAAELVGGRDGVENPLPLAGPHVEAADVALDVLAAGWRAAAAVRRADDHRVAGDDRRAVPADLAGERIDRLIIVLLQVDDAVLPERRHRDAGPRIQRDQLVADRHQVNPLVLLAVGPIGDAAARHPTERVGTPFAFVQAVHPEKLARRRVDRDCVPPAARCCVQDAVNHQRGRLVVEVRRGAEVLRPEAPRHLQIVEVRSVDLIERRIARAAEVAAVGAPLALRRAVLRGGERRRQDEREPGDDCGCCPSHRSLLPGESRTVGRERQPLAAASGAWLDR